MRKISFGEKNASEEKDAEEKKPGQFGNSNYGVSLKEDI